MGEWYDKNLSASFGAEGKAIVGITSKAQRAKTLREKPFLMRKMYRDPAVGVLQDELIVRNKGPKAQALKLKIAADPTDHGDYGPATQDAALEFILSDEGQAAELKGNGVSINKYFWAALEGKPAAPGTFPIASSLSRRVTQAGMLGNVPTWVKILALLGIGGAAVKKFSHK